MPERAAVELSQPQLDFITTDAKYPAFVGGFGAGKTFAGVHRAISKKLQYKELDVAYYLPTYDLATLIAYPCFESELTKLQIPHKINESKKLINFPNGSKIIVRTMDKPQNIIGYQVADSILDELDTLPTDKAAEVWRKAVSRNRQKKPDGKPNTLGVATTPEGFKFVYEKWERNPFPRSQIIRAHTSSNPYIDEDYIQSLIETYPERQLAAYLEGQFVNLTTGCVYNEFDRTLNATTETVKEGETLHIGVDFNVEHMAGAVHVLRGDDPHAVDEFVDYYDTPALIEAIKERYPDHSIMIYPDASGKSRKTVNASQSDIALLGEAGFTVLANKANPFVRDRLAAVNKLIHKGGKRRYKVNVEKCPHLVECLEKQAYNKNGEPDKDSGLDHLVDAAGYFIAYRYPVQHGKAIITKLTGV